MEFIMSVPFHPLAQPNNEAGQPRRVGFELEFTGVSLERIIEIVAGVLGEGDIVKHNHFMYTLQNTRYGDFVMEVDASFLKDETYKTFLTELGLADALAALEQKLDHALEFIASSIVPYEIVTPPLLFEQFTLLTALNEQLRAANARGSKASWVYAFGLHINPEVPSTQTDVLLAYLQAFVLLYPWIRKHGRVDISRRISPYITPFPDEYVKKILAADYQPNQTQLIYDYLADNPTRNRALDLTPLFMELDRNQVLAQLDPNQHHLVKPRPTFHYRLPNSLIDQVEWSIAQEWNYWILIEQLANDRKRLQAMSAAWLAFNQGSLMDGHWFTSWTQEVPKWL
jgi:hypothetical protein